MERARLRRGRIVRREVDEFAVFTRAVDLGLERYGAFTASACTANPGSGTAVPASPSANIIEIGTIGELPPRVHATGPRLTYPPPSSLRIAQSFPLGSIVKFQIPLRNDGDAPLIIDKVEPT